MRTITITISEDDLRNLLLEKHNLEKQVTELQTKNTEMLTDLRELTSAVKNVVQEDPNHWKQVCDDDHDLKKVKSNPTFLVKKADLCVKVISLIMTTSRKSNDQLVEDLSIELMSLDEKQIQNMYNLLTMEDAFPSYDSGLNQYDLDCMKRAKGSGKTIKTDKSADDDFPDYSERPHGR